MARIRWATLDLYISFPVRVPGSRLGAREQMTFITVKFTVEEADVLADLASDQLFRREFIDPKMPGYRSNSAETRQGKALVERLRLMIAKGCSKKTHARTVA